MQKEILVSVIVTAYNIEQYLPRCLDSLLAQTYRPLEILVVDDGSTDKTPEICDDYAGKNDCVQVIHKENGGVSSARNAGLGAARGDFIGFVDGDDWVDPQMYEKLLEACLKADAQISVCSYRQFGKGAWQSTTTGNTLELSMEEAVELFVYGREGYRISVSVWGKLFESRIVKELRFVEGKTSEDIIYTTWALTRAEKCVLLDVPYYNYMVDRGSSIMNTLLEKRRFQDEIPFWREQISYLTGIGLEDLAEKAAYGFYKRMLNYYLDFRERRMKGAAGRMKALLRAEKAQIDRIYKKDFVKKGDKVRMRMALLTPEGYYRLVKLYDRFVIPLRQ